MSLHLKIAVLVGYVALCIALVLTGHDSEMLGGHAAAASAARQG